MAAAIERTKRRHPARRPDKYGPLIILIVSRLAATHANRRRHQRALHHAGRDVPLCPQAPAGACGHSGTSLPAWCRARWCRRRFAWVAARRETIRIISGPYLSGRRAGCRRFVLSIAAAIEACAQPDQTDKH